MDKLVIILLLILIGMSIKWAYVAGFEAGINSSLATISKSEACHARHNDPACDEY